MPRYFLEVCYQGTGYSGFQFQENANTIQREIENALVTRLRKWLVEAQMDKFKLTGSSRTDAGVHALQNYFHFDSPFVITTQHVYNLNAMLPPDIAILGLHEVMPYGHCRFDATSREYKYCIYKGKNPFLNERGYYYPYKTDVGLLNEVAALVVGKQDFSSFSKRKTEVKTFICTIQRSEWVVEDDCILYNVTGNRFLRGMVRGLVGTMLNVCKLPNPVEGFKSILSAKDCTKVDFSVPGHGLFLMKVNYPDGYFEQPIA